jgi:hypothetical protein
MDYKARFYDPYLAHFVQPDTITSGGPQGLNRYSYTVNNPINLTDPTGHDTCDEQGFCYSSSKGKYRAVNRTDFGAANYESFDTTDDDSSAGNDDGRESGKKGYIPDNCWGEHPCITNKFIPPPTGTLHPLQGNVVLQEPIYDYSYYPPLLIGYRITSYASNYDLFSLNGIQVNYKNLIVPSDALTWASTIDTGIKYSKILEPSIQTLASVGIRVSCPFCSSALTILSTIDSINSAVTINVHLRTHDIYFSKPIFPGVFESPFNYPFNVQLSP